MDFSHTNIALRRSIWSSGKVQRIVAALHRHFYGIPHLRWGTIKNVSRKRGHIFCDYVSRHDSGLYSNISTTLEDILALRRAGVNITRIDYSVGMNWFKDHMGKDVYPEYFNKARYSILDGPDNLTFDAFDVHKIYKHLPLSDLCKAASFFFHPSSSVINTADGMIKSSGVTPERSVAIVYRGTDKISEVKPASIEEYIRAADAILKTVSTDFSVLVQTDQEQVRDQVVKSFGKRCRFFNELPVTRGRTAVHELDFGTEIAMSREEFAKRIMAAALILSKCAYVITHTGNVGAWIAIYRGTSKNLYQFDASAQLQMP